MWKRTICAQGSKETGNFGGNPCKLAHTLLVSTNGSEPLPVEVCGFGGSSWMTKSEGFRKGSLFARDVCVAARILRACNCMSALPRNPDVPLLITDWQADVTQLLDESHLVAWSEFAARRTQFAVQLGQFLGRLKDAEVIVLYGKFITDLDSFCYQLERAIPGPHLERRIHGPHGVVNLLRERAHFRGRSDSKYRFYIWHDADVLLKHDAGLFGQLLDAFAGVAAEAEYVSDDALLLHRAVLIGSSMLDMYAEDPSGQCCRWHDDGQGEPFWQVVTGIEAPPFMRYRIDVLGAPAVEVPRIART